MSIEVVQSIEAVPSKVINYCRKVAEGRTWKVLSDTPETGSLIYKTPTSWLRWWGYYVNISIHQHGSSSLITINVELGGVQIFDLTREGTRLARGFTRDVLYEFERDSL